MIKSLQAQNEDTISSDIAEIYYSHSKMLYRISYAYMKNAADSEDIVADVFVNLIKSGVKFKNAEHEKAWLIRTAINICKNNLKHWRNKCADIDSFKNFACGEQTADYDNIIIAVMNLPEKYKAVVYLYYYEGYRTAEIAKMLKKPHSTIRVYIHESKKILKGVLKDEE